MMEKVRNWLVEEGFYKDKVADDKATFHFVAESPSKQAIIEVIQPKNREDQIILATKISLAEEHKSSLKNMPKDQREDLMWNIRFSLLFLNSGFSIQLSGENPENFQFTRELYHDGLSKQLFMDSLKEIDRCHLFIKWKLLQLFGKTSSSDTQEPMYG